MEHDFFVYQVRECYGEWEEVDRLRKTFYRPEDASACVKELEEQESKERALAKRCNDCPYNSDFDEEDIEKGKAYCKDFCPVREETSCSYYCDNYFDKWDYPTFYIEKVKVYV